MGPHVGTTSAALCPRVACSPAYSIPRSCHHAPRVLMLRSSALCRLHVAGPWGLTYVWGPLQNLATETNPNCANMFFLSVRFFLCFRVHVFDVSCNTLTLTGFCCSTCTVLVNVASFLNGTRKLKFWEHT